MLLYSEGDTPAQEADAKELMEILTLAYPDHPWGVRVMEQQCFVRYLDPLYETLYRGPVGVVVKMHNVHSASELKRQVVNAGGELLERMGLRRGASNGDEPTKVEGVPKQFEKTNLEIPISNDRLP